MKSDTQELGRLIMGMRAAYARGGNAMAHPPYDDAGRFQAMFCNL